MIEEYDLPIETGDYEFKASGRLTSSHGNCHPPDKGNCTEGACLVKLSWKAFKNHGWESTKDTIRHELIHVIQFQQDGYADHGRKFQQWAPKLDTSTRCDEPAEEKDYKYVITCEECGLEYRRQRKSKSVKYPDRYNCGDCGGSLSVQKL